MAAAFENTCVYTLTLNPSIDYVVEVPELKLNMTNRTVYEHAYCGGKGINVSAVLHQFGIRTVATGFVAGFTGAEIRRQIAGYGFESDFVELDQGASRINIKIRNIEGTEINGAGPDISPRDFAKLQEKLDVLREGDMLVMAGSIPRNMSPDTYADIMRNLSGRNIKTVVDTTGDSLNKALKYRPFLVKPNIHELGELFGITVNAPDEAVPYAKRLINAGAENVIVSMGSAGAFFVDSDMNVTVMPAIEIEAVNTVGAGDSMVAGFIAGFLKTGSLNEAFKFAVAAGTATAAAEALADRESVLRMYNSLKMMPSK